MKTKKKYSGFWLPIAVIGVGAFLIITERYSVSVVGPVEEGGLVVFAGALLCALGLWGVFRAFAALRRGEEPIQPTEPTPGDYT